MLDSVSPSTNSDKKAPLGGRFYGLIGQPISTPFPRAISPSLFIFSRLGHVPTNAVVSSIQLYASLLPLSLSSREDHILSALFTDFEATLRARCQVKLFSMIVFIAHRAHPFLRILKDPDRVRRNLSLFLSYPRDLLSKQFAKTFFTFFIIFFSLRSHNKKEPSKALMSS